MKKLRTDANILLAGVISLNRENIEIWDDYKNDSIAYLKISMVKILYLLLSTLTRNIHIYTSTAYKTQEKGLIYCMTVKKLYLKIKIRKTRSKYSLLGFNESLSGGFLQSRKL